MQASQFLRNLSAAQQVGALFLLVFGLLTVATTAWLAVSLREVEEHWSLDDLADAHDALDVWDALEVKSAERIKER